MKLYSIKSKFFTLNGGAMLGIVPKSLWQRTTPADERNLCTLTTRLLLIEDGRQLIFIHPAIGDTQVDKSFSHYYLHGDASLDRSFAKHGFHRDDITDIILTHLHFDDCGGAIKREGDRLVPAFKKARFWSNEKHW